MLELFFTCSRLESWNMFETCWNFRSRLHSCPPVQVPMQSRLGTCPAWTMLPKHKHHCCLTAARPEPSNKCDSWVGQSKICTECDRGTDTCVHVVLSPAVQGGFCSEKLVLHWLCLGWKTGGLFPLQERLAQHNLKVWSELPANQFLSQCWPFGLKTTDVRN